jgi:protocatechuate 3,4-dioxygenase beta subunit
MTSRLWSRRHAIGAFAASATGPIASSPAFAQKQEPAAKLIVPDKLCLLTPRAIEGPYYFDPKLMRSDVTEARPGVPLRLRLQVLEARNCTPLKNARVDIWHADAIGHYSGYERQGDDRSVSTTGQTFLRGTQLSDEAGLVVFRTLYPGWYEGRTPHIHFRAFVHDRSVLTGQLYFADALSEFIYSNVAPYNTRKLKRDTVNATDLVLRQGGGGLTSFCSIREEEDCYDAAMVIGVNRDAIEMPDRFGPPDAGFARGGPPPEFDHRGERQIPDLGAALVPGVNKRS